MTSPKPSASPSADRPARPRLYGTSLLLTACSRMWRGVVPGTLAVVANAMVQAGLVHLDAPTGANPAFMAAVAVSVVAILAGGAVITATALESVTGPARLGPTLARVRAHLPSYLAWSLALWTVMIAAGMLVPGLATVVALVGAMVPIAAMAGHRNAIGSAMRALRERFGRWLATSVLVAAGAFVWWLASAVNVFFVTGMLAALVAWFVGGLLLWWLAVAWACLYRSTLAGSQA